MAFLYFIFVNFRIPYSLYLSLNSKTKIITIPKQDALQDVDSIIIGLGTGGLKGDICYRTIVIGDEWVFYVHSTSSFLFSIQVKTLAQQICQREICKI